MLQENKILTECNDSRNDVIIPFRAVEVEDGFLHCLDKMATRGIWKKSQAFNHIKLFR